jgi:hypothetical protein
LLLEEVDGMALALGEDGHQHSGHCHFLVPGRLELDHGALGDALKGSGRCGIAAVVDHQCFQLVVDIVGQVLLERSKIDLAAVHDRRSIFIVCQGEQEMLERRVLMPSLVGVGEGPMKGRLEWAGKQKAPARRPRRRRRFGARRR